MKKTEVAKFIKNLFSNKFLDGIYIVDYNIYVLGFSGVIGHPLYWFFWTYVDPKKYESIVLRSFGFLISLMFVLYEYWPESSKRKIKLYWFGGVCYNLTFSFTALFILNDFSLTWSCAMMAGIIFSVMILPNPAVLFLNFFIGVSLAILYYLSVSLETVSFHKEFFITYVPLFSFAICIGYAFSYCNIKGIAVRARVLVIKSLAGSIAHEIRNPLNTIKLIGGQIDEVLKADSLNVSKDKLSLLTSQISSAISDANNIINIILNDLSDKSPDQGDFTYIEVHKVLPKIIDQYGYKNKEEKAKIRLLELNNIKSPNFIFRAVPERFIFVVYNLLKNALYYTNVYPESVVTLGAETRNIDGKDWNVIYVHDTGPGIKEEVMIKLFEDFYTSGKKEGTGLGLAFCKRNMKAFGGDIICESEYGNGKSGWTKFSMLFPKLSEEEISQAKEIISAQKDDSESDPVAKNDNSLSKNSAIVNSNKRKVLIVDDEKTNLLVTKSKIEKNLNVVCDTADNGKIVLDLIKKDITKYDIILMDIQMPEMDGITAAKKIKGVNPELPIIALTSLDYETFDVEDRKYFNYYLNKPVAGHILHRTIGKFIPALRDEIEYLGSEDQYLPELKGKRIILADDQELNLKITSKKFTNLGLEVVTANDGKELVNLFQESLKSGSKFDLIATDINMSLLNGDEAAKQIREIEVKAGITHSNQIPIIAITGDGQKKDTDSFLAAQMNDYFVKGEDPNKLVKIIALYLSSEKIYFGKKHKKVANEVQNKKIKDEQEIKIINPDKLRYFNDIEKKELLKIFIEESSELLKDVEESLEQGKQQMVSKALHALKGISGNIGADIFYRNVKQIESTFKKAIDISDKTWLKNLRKSYQQLIEEIKKIIP